MNQQILEPKAFESGVQFGWDSTSIKLVEECMRKYKYKMIDGWTSPELSVHLIFGAHYATALEHFHKHRAQGVDFEEAVHLVVLEALVATWNYDKDEEGNAIPGTGSAWHSLHNFKTRENLIRTIIWYLEQFSDDSMTTLILSDGKAGVEYSFALPVDDDIILSGHLDRMVEYAGHPYVQDQKTTGSTITPRYFEGYNPDTQMSMYTFAGKAIFGIPVKGVVIDAAQIAVGFTRFERGFTFRTDGQLNEWYDTTMWRIEEARRMTRENFFPMNAQACNNYGGCPFRQVCSRSPEVRDQFLKAQFVQGERWDPLRSR